MATTPALPTSFTVAELVSTLFGDFDTNKDGALTAKELAPLQRSIKMSDAAFKTAFAKFDANNDGKITKAEVTEVLAKADANHDGRLTIAELKAGAELIGVTVDYFQHHHF